jgi:hypothetical protein
MGLKNYKKFEIAIHLLKTALSLYFKEKDYLSVIHLAGASEEILGKYLKIKGKKNSIYSIKEAGIALQKLLYKKDVDEKEFADSANYVKNSIKHMYASNDSNIKLDAKKEARQMLDRAIVNYWRLERNLTPVMRKFYDTCETPGSDTES